MWPSYRLVVMFMRPILDRPKSVSLMWPMEVINKLERNSRKLRNDVYTRGKQTADSVGKRSKN